MAYMDLALAQARQALDDNGAVGAVIVQDGTIVAVAGSDVKTGHHAEHDCILRAGWLDDGIVKDVATMYVTYQPCIRRTSGFASCAEYIYRAGIRNVIYGARDPNFRTEDCDWMYQSLGLAVRQVDDPEMIEQCREVFDESFTRCDVHGASSR